MGHSPATRCPPAGSRDAHSCRYEVPTGTRRHEVPRGAAARCPLACLRGARLVGLRGAHSRGREVSFGGCTRCSFGGREVATGARLHEVSSGAASRCPLTRPRGVHSWGRERGAHSWGRGVSTGAAVRCPPARRPETRPSANRSPGANRSARPQPQPWRPLSPGASRRPGAPAQPRRKPQPRAPARTSNPAPAPTSNPAPAPTPTQRQPQPEPSATPSPNPTAGQEHPTEE